MSIAPPGANAFDLANLDFVPPSDHGAVTFKGSVAWEDLAPGISGQFLRSNGLGADLVWTSVPGGGDMLAAIYDPGAVVGNAFDLANFDVAGSVHGSIYYKGVAGWTHLAPSVSGRVLTTADVGFDPAWANAPGNMLVSVYDPGGVVGNAFDLALFEIASSAPGDLYTRGSGAWERLAVGAPQEVLKVDPTTNRPVWAVTPLPANHVDGLNLAFSTVAAITVSSGRCKADDDLTDIIEAVGLTVSLAVSGAGGLDTGSEAADTWYFVWIIDGSAVAVAGLFSISDTAPTLPGGYTVKRRIGVVRNNGGSDIIDFIQSGSGRDRSVLYVSALSSRVVLSTGTAEVPTAVDLSAFVPPTTQKAILTIDNKSNTRLMDVHQTTGGPVLEELENSDSRSLLFPTSASQTVAYANDGAGGDANISVRGFLESV